MDYKKDKDGEYKATGSHVFLERESWKGTFGWQYKVLSYPDEKGFILSVLTLH